jgi:hypothetical protein
VVGFNILRLGSKQEEEEEKKEKKRKNLDTG